MVHCKEFHMADTLVESFDGLPCRLVPWLWRGRLARGKLAIFDGDPGLGKSFITLDLAARVTGVRCRPVEFIYYRIQPPHSWRNRSWPNRF